MLDQHSLARHWRLSLTAVATAATAVRAVALQATSAYHPIHDDASYARVAQSLMSLGRYPVFHVAHVGWLPSAYRPPGWPLLLAGAWSATGISIDAGRLVLLALGVTACVLGAQIGRRIASERAGLAAGLLLAVDPLLIASSASLESEALFTTLLLGAVLAALCARESGRRRWAIAAGALIGAAALTRTNALALVPVIAWLVVPRPRARGGWRGAAVAVAAAVVVVSPWTIRNLTELHHFVPVSTEAGNTLAGTYNTVSMRHDARWLPSGRTGAYRSIFLRWPDSPQRDTHLESAVLHWTLKHPGYPLVVAAWNTARFLGFDGPRWARWSLHTMSLGPAFSVPVWLGTLLVTLLAAIEIARRRGRAGPLGLVALVLLATTVPFNGEMRLAVPLQALLVVLGACAVADGLGRRLGREERRRDVALT